MRLECGSDIVTRVRGNKQGLLKYSSNSHDSKGSSSSTLFISTNIVIAAPRQNVRQVDSWYERRERLGRCESRQPGLEPGWGESRQEIGDRRIGDTGDTAIRRYWPADGVMARPRYQHTGPAHITSISDRRQQHRLAEADHHPDMCLIWTRSSNILRTFRTFAPSSKCLIKYR